MADIFLHKYVARSAAALSYYLTLSIFPFLICVSAILGRLNIGDSETLAFLTGILPTEPLLIVVDFFRHISENRTELMLVIGLSAMLTTSSAAYRSFKGIMGEIQGEVRFKGIWGGVFSFFFSLAFLIAIYVSGLIILSGEWLILVLDPYFGAGEIFALWSWVRFVILFLLLFGFIFSVYLISAPKETKKMQRLPGALGASIILVVSSIIYSHMITVSIRYQMVYGSLASFIIVMIWLYTCGLILIMGNVFNISLHKSKTIREADAFWNAI